MTNALFLRSLGLDTTVAMGGNWADIPTEIRRNFEGALGELKEAHRAQHAELAQRIRQQGASTADAVAQIGAACDGFSEKIASLEARAPRRAVAASPRRRARSHLFASRLTRRARARARAPRASRRASPRARASCCASPRPTALRMRGSQTAKGGVSSDLSGCAVVALFRPGQFGLCSASMIALISLTACGNCAERSVVCPSSRSMSYKKKWPPS